MMIAKQVMTKKPSEVHIPEQVLDLLSMEILWRDAVSIEHKIDDVSKEYDSFEKIWLVNTFKVNTPKNDNPNSLLEALMRGLRPEDSDPYLTLGACRTVKRIRNKDELHTETKLRFCVMYYDLMEAMSQADRLMKDYSDMIEKEQAGVS
jgi:hypothetical protein